MDELPPTAPNPTTAAPNHGDPGQLGDTVEEPTNRLQVMRDPEDNEFCLVLPLTWGRCIAADPR